MSERPTSGVRYALAHAQASAELAEYRGFAHLPEADVPLTVRVALPSGAVKAEATPTSGVPAARLAELSKAVAALVRAATKGDVAEGRVLPRKITRWRG